MQYLVLLWALVSLAWVINYLKNTIKGKAKPNRISRLIRSVAPMISNIAALSDRIRRVVLPVFMSGFGPFLVFLVSFINKKAYWKLEKSDYICGIFSALALILRAITKDPAIELLFLLSQVTDSQQFQP